MQLLLPAPSEPFPLGQTHVHHNQVIGVRAQGGKPCRNRGGRGHRKVGVRGLLEKPRKAGRIAWGMREDKELIYWHAILLSPKHPLRRVGAWVVGSDIRRGQAGTLQCVGCPRGTTVRPRCRLDVLHDQHRQDCGGRYGPGNTP